jgi:transcriptional regulator with XRE-family HTH domain
VIRKLYLTKRFKELREEKGYTQKELAELLSIQLGKGISVGLVQKWEQKARPIAPIDAVAISRYFNISMKEFTEGEK